MPLKTECYMDKGNNIAIPSEVFTRLDITIPAYAVLKSEKISNGFNLGDVAFRKEIQDDGLIHLRLLEPTNYDINDWFEAENK